MRYSRTRNFVLAVSLMLCLCLPALARDGAPELSELMSARDSGLLTDWRIVGPFGLHPLTDFDRQWAPERDHIQKSAYGSRKVEFFQFTDGQVKLPSYLARDGVFYASSQVYLHSAGDWRLFLESGGTLAVFIDGEKVLTRDDRHASQPTSLRSDLITVARRSPRSGQISQWRRAFSPGDHGSHRRTAASSEHSECPRSGLGVRLRRAALLGRRFAAALVASSR